MNRMDKNNQFWRFENSMTENNEATLYIYGDIMQYDMEWWNWPDDVIPHRFRQELAELGEVNTIHVRINSNGGSVFGAYAIMNLLKSHKAQIITYNDGIAASAATLIAMAGDKIISALGSVWMIHLPATTVFGNVTELQKAISILETIKDSMLDVYHKRTGIEKDALLVMMNEDTWLTGTQALEKGFVDEVTELEVVAYLGEDKKTAFFNGLAVGLEEIPNKDVLASLLKPKPQTQPVQMTLKTATAQAVPGRNPAAKPVLPQAKLLMETPIQEEESIMNLEELKAKYPEIYNDVFAAGVEQGVQNERARIQEIDNMALPGMEELTNKAKYETGVTAGDFAVELIKAQKQKGVNYLAAAQVDADEAGDVPPAGAPMDDAAEEEALLAHAGESAKNIRR